MSSFVWALGHLTSLSRPGEVLLIFEADDTLIGWVIIDGERVLLSVEIPVVNIVQEAFLIMGSFDARYGIRVEVVSSSFKGDGVFRELEKPVGVPGFRGLPHP